MACVNIKSITQAHMLHSEPAQEPQVKNQGFLFRQKAREKSQQKQPILSIQPTPHRPPTTTPEQRVVPLPPSASESLGILCNEAQAPESWECDQDQLQGQARATAVPEVG